MRMSMWMDAFAVPLFGVCLVAWGEVLLQEATWSFLKITLLNEEQR